MARGMTALRFGLVTLLLAGLIATGCGNGGGSNDTTSYNAADASICRAARDALSILKTALGSLPAAQADSYLSAHLQDFNADDDTIKSNQAQSKLDGAVVVDDHWNLPRDDHRNSLPLSGWVGHW
jgi:hypothetical protein